MLRTSAASLASLKRDQPDKLLLLEVEGVVRCERCAGAHHAAAPRSVQPRRPLTLSAGRGATTEGRRRSRWGDRVGGKNPVLNQPSGPFAPAGTRLQSFLVARTGHIRGSRGDGAEGRSLVGFTPPPSGRYCLDQHPAFAQPRVVGGQGPALSAGDGLQAFSASSLLPKVWARTLARDRDACNS